LNEELICFLADLHAVVLGSLVHECFGRQYRKQEQRSDPAKDRITSHSISPQWNHCFSFYVNRKKILSAKNKVNSKRRKKELVNRWNIEIFVVDQKEEFGDVVIGKLSLDLKHLLKKLSKKSEKPNVKANQENSLMEKEQKDDKKENTTEVVNINSWYPLNCANSSTSTISESDIGSTSTSAISSLTKLLKKYKGEPSLDEQDPQILLEITCKPLEPGKINFSDDEDLQEEDDEEDEEEEEEVENDYNTKIKIDSNGLLKREQEIQKQAEEERKRKEEEEEECRKRKEEYETKLKSMNGYLLKKGHSRKNWKVRWFTIRGKDLLYFKDKTKQKGSIPLHLCNSIEIEDVDGYPFCFRLEPHEEYSEKEFVLSARNLEERKLWITALNLVSILPLPKPP